MAKKKSRPARPLLTLLVMLIAMAGALIGGHQNSDAQLTPLLALDLEGGTQLILTPKLISEGGETPTPGETTDPNAPTGEITGEDIDQAIEIIRQRVDASGVAEAEITRQGQNNIVVGIPGEPSKETLDLVRQSAVLRFRPVIGMLAPGALNPEAFQPAEPTPSTPPSLGELPTVTENVTETEGGTETTTVTEEATEAPTGSEEATETPTESPTEPESPDIDPNASAEDIAFQLADRNQDGVLQTEPSATPAHPSDDNWITEKLYYDAFLLDCTNPASLTGGDESDINAATVSCAKDGSAKFLLGPAEVLGTQITSASSGLGTTATGATTNEWIVTLSLNDEATKVFAETSQRLLTYRGSATEGQKNSFAIVLDGLVLQAPGIENVIPNGQAMIRGGFTQATSATLANQLNFGSLPLNFEVESENQLSATVGFEQLERGIIAGLIGLALVVLYMLWQYNALGFLALASLSVAGLITYLAITLLGWTSGYRLSLAGVAGLIVAIGITADSFILYFERVRDEVREGRALADAVERGWLRARRTILASDAVSFLAAIVLYFLAVGGVRGFAFTLGLTTIVDLLVVFVFTHPMLQLLIRTKYFGEGKKFSGLEPEKLGARAATYRGRGQVRTIRSIAERKAAEAREKEDADA